MRSSLIKMMFFLIILPGIVWIYSCEKDGNDLEMNTTDAIIIDSISASHYSVKAWDTTTITCYATGQNMVYAWECDHGNFNGGGTQIKYAAGECHSVSGKRLWLPDQHQNRSADCHLRFAGQSRKNVRPYPGCSQHKPRSCL